MVRDRMWSIKWPTSKMWWLLQSLFGNGRKSWRVVAVVQLCILGLSDYYFFDQRWISDFLLFTVINYILIWKLFYITRLGIFKSLPDCLDRETNRHKEISYLLIFWRIIYRFPFIITCSIYRHFKAVAICFLFLISYSSCRREQLFPSKLRCPVGHLTLMRRPFSNSFSKIPPVPPPVPSLTAARY